jgi:hypothetical protein
MWWPPRTTSCDCSADNAGYCRLKRLHTACGPFTSFQPHETSSRLARTHSGRTHVSPMQRPASRPVLWPPAVSVGRESTVDSRSAAIMRIVDLFLRLDPDLLHVACEASPPPEPELSRQSAEAWLRGLKDSEKLSLLVRLLTDSEPHHLRAELIQRVKRAVVQTDEPVPGSRRARRTVHDLLAAAARRRRRALARHARRPSESAGNSPALSPAPALGIWKDSSGITTNYGSKSKHLSPPNVKPTTLPW